MSSVQGLAAFEHLDVLGDACGSRGRPLEVGDTEGHREPVLRRLRREGLGDLWVRVQGFLKLSGDVVVALPVRVVPAAVRLALSISR